MLIFLIILFQHPWAIAILLEDELHCSGSILSETYVLTAAHCFENEGYRYDKTKFTIIAGSDDPENPIPESKKIFVQKRNVEDVKMHPLAESPAARYDLAIIKINPPFTFRNSRWPICLPEAAQPRTIHSGHGYTLVGFGRDINKESQGSVLTDLNLIVQPTNACSSKYSRILNDELNDLHYLIKNALPNNFDDDSLICASVPGKTSGSCPGDSGGLAMNNEWVDTLEDYRAFQVAVIHGAAQKCNGQRYPQILIRLDTSETISWINSIAFSKGMIDFGCL